MTRSRPAQWNCGPRVIWAVFCLISVVEMALAIWFLLLYHPYRIDVDVYQMAGHAWLTGQPLYSDVFQTQVGADLPFTYPPLAAIAFGPLSMLSLQTASVAITLVTIAALMVAMTIVLTRLRMWPFSTTVGQPAWVCHGWLAAAIVAAAAVLFEPIRSNVSFGQINVALMTLVIADCVPRRTWWPRGLLLGIAIAVKLTPAVFLLYFMLRRDGRTTVTAVISFALATAAGFALARRDSLQYWTDTVGDADRIGDPTLNTNQNIAGALARLGLGEDTRLVVWMLACSAVLALTVWAVRQVLRADEPMLALMCVALFGLMVSPVSWSHHWVWVLPTVATTAVLAHRRQSAALWAVTLLGVLVMEFEPLRLLPENDAAAAALWRQVAALAYVWWALAVIVVSGLALRVGSVRIRPAQESRVRATERVVTDCTAAPARA